MTVLTRSRRKHQEMTFTLDCTQTHKRHDTRGRRRVRCEEVQTPDGSTKKRKIQGKPRKMKVKKEKLFDEDKKMYKNNREKDSKKLLKEQESTNILKEKKQPEQVVFVTQESQTNTQAPAETQIAPVNTYAENTTLISTFSTTLFSNPELPNWDEVSEPWRLTRSAEPVTLWRKLKQILRHPQRLQSHRGSPPTQSLSSQTLQALSMT